MSYVTLAKAKQHLAVFHDLDDQLIQTYIDAAEQYAADYMGRPSIGGPQCVPWRKDPECEALVSSSESSSETPDEVPHSVVVAILLIVGDYYENRTQGIAGTIYSRLPAVDNILHFHRVGLGV